jgi:hypothetical protein
MRKQYLYNEQECELNMWQINALETSGLNSKAALENTPRKHGFVVPSTTTMTLHWGQYKCNCF